MEGASTAGRDLRRVVRSVPRHSPRVVSPLCSERTIHLKLGRVRGGVQLRARAGVTQRYRADAYPLMEISTSDILHGAALRPDHEPDKYRIRRGPGCANARAGLRSGHAIHTLQEATAEPLVRPGSMAECGRAPTTNRAERMEVL